MKPKKKPVLDVLTERFQEYSRKELYSMIMCGEIKVNGETIRSPQNHILPEADINLSSKKWVSRGGEKLDHAMVEWGISAEKKVVLDAGSSTGGFTDCLLQRKASLVHAVDVGYNQLDYSLRIDSRVNVLERTNIMSVEELEPVPNFAVADLSFRSISGAASHILRLTSDNLLIALIKPQFELPETEGFDGVIRDEEILHEVIRKTALNLQVEGVGLRAVIESPIKGGKGNTEFLFLLSLVADIVAEGNETVIDEYLS